MRHLCLLAVGTLLLVTSLGCGGGGASNPTSTPIPNATPTPTPVPTPTPAPTPQTLVIASGNWDFTATDNVGTTLALGNLTQTGSTISGVFHLSNAACAALLTDIPVSGTAVTNGLLINTPQVGTQGAITGSLIGTSTSVAGSYTETGGCTGPDTGSLNGVFVPPLTGTWSGLFQSNSGPTFTITTSLTQTAADIHGIAGVTGTGTVTGSTCFTGLTVTGSGVAGRVVNITMLGSDGSTTTFNGQLTSPATAKQLTGIYSVVGGLCNGDAGSGTISRP